jgi:hypothetical protein
MNALATTGIMFSNQIPDLNMENNEEILSRLKFLGFIQEDEKIDVRHVNRQPNSFVTKLYRNLIYPDNRANSLKFVKTIIDRSFEIIDRFLINNNILSCKTMILDLIKAKQGINNLKFAYKDDTKFCCDMDVIIEKINSKLILLKNKNNFLFEDNIILKPNDEQLEA